MKHDSTVTVILRGKLLRHRAGMSPNASHQMFIHPSRLGEQIVASRPINEASWG